MKTFQKELKKRIAETELIIDSLLDESEEIPSLQIWELHVRLDVYREVLDLYEESSK